MVGPGLERSACVVRLRFKPAEDAPNVADIALPKMAPPGKPVAVTVMLPAGVT